MADLLGNIKARAELRSGLRYERRLRARARNAEIRRTLLRPRSFALGLVVAVAAVAALVLGRSLGTDPVTRPSSLGASEVSGGRLVLSGWSGWLDAQTPSALEDLLPGAVAAKPLVLQGVTVLVGDVAGGDVPRLLSAVRSRDADGAVLAAGDLSVRMYSGRLVGQAPLTATVLLVPTQDGASAAICVGDPRQSVTAAGDCDSLLPSTMTLRGSLPTPASPSSASAAVLASALGRLDRARRAGVPALAATGTSGRQAQRAQRLSASYAGAARTVGGISFTTLAATSGSVLVERLAAGGRAFAALAAAAREHSPTKFDQARADVITADAAIARSLAQLGTLGYRR